MGKPSGGGRIWLGAADAFAGPSAGGRLNQAQHVLVLVVVVASGDQRLQTADRSRTHALGDLRQQRLFGLMQRGSDDLGDPIRGGRLDQLRSATRGSRCGGAAPCGWRTRTTQARRLARALGGRGAPRRHRAARGQRAGNDRARAGTSAAPRTPAASRRTCCAADPARRRPA